ncbi:MAG: DUF1189 family protein, partial [Candidatus Brocadiae bacterium]|nr:DUF1189 family protein [Candidatus Brocadiia bacterium]
MSQPYPNHFLSILRCVFSLKHYSDVHDQPFTRSLLFVVIVALVLTAVGLGVDAVGHFKQAAEHASELGVKLGEVAFADGKASAGGDLPRTVWAYRTGGKEGHRSIVAVLDTGDTLDTTEKTTELVGCPQSSTIVVLGRDKIEVFDRDPEKDDAEGESEGKAEGKAEGKSEGKAESKAKGKEKGQDKPPVYGYDNAEKVAEMKKRVEDNGGQFPAFKIVNGKAQFELEKGKVHILCQTTALTALADATGREGTTPQILQAEVKEDQALRDRLIPPDFIIVLSSSEVTVAGLRSQQTVKSELAALSTLDAAAVGTWAAGAVRQMQTATSLRSVLPFALMNGFQLFILALLCSVAGVAVNAVLRGSLVYAESLTMAVYATVPASLISMVFMQLVSLPPGAMWGLAIPVGCGVVYTALGAARTIRTAG